MVPRFPFRKDGLKRLDRLAADLNVVLLLFAFGLATLDATLFVTQRVVDQLPNLQRAALVNGQGAPTNLVGDRAAWSE